MTFMRTMMLLFPPTIFTQIWSLMIKRSIKIIKTLPNFWIVSIDGHILQFSRHRNSVDLGNAEDVQAMLDIIDDVFIWHRTFRDVHNFINGTNLLLILDALYPQNTIQLFKFLYQKQFSDAYIPFEEFFRIVFSFSCEIRLFRISLVLQLRSIVHETVEFHKKLSMPQIFAQSDSFSVKYILTSNNIASFMINGNSFDICLVGRSYMIDAVEVLHSIISIQSALSNRNRTELDSVIENIGSIATIRILQICFPELTLTYFTDLIEQKIERREFIYPHLLLKEHFRRAPYRGEARTFYYELLETLERNLPFWNQRLIDGNRQEVSSCKRQWIIFYFGHPTVLTSHTISFAGSDKILSEQQKYAVAHSVDASGNMNVNSLYKDASEISICIKTLYDLDVYLDSIFSLTKTDVQLLLSHFFQNTSYNYKTIKRYVFNFRLFHKFITGIDDSSLSSPFHNLQLPPFSPNPTRPLSQQAKDIIVQKLSTLPTVIQLGIKILCCTGLRPSSFDMLSVFSLIHHDGKYIIRVFLKKTYKYRIKNGLPTYIDYEIPQELGIQLNSYVADTKDLRAKLDKPYLLIYQPKCRRADTHMQPTVLSAASVGYYMTKIVQEANLQTADGVPEKVTFRRIRAEIGRILFASGKNAKEVSEFLGNSPMVAQTHYDNYQPIDDAIMYDNLWQETIEKGIASCTKQDIAPHPVMYGTCTSKKDCSEKDCRNCPSLIQCKGGDTNDFRSPPTSK